ncbi:hypothetical protein FSP39_016292 [Pinctada imbricata]|uniref:Deacetylase sirtuin-type domain-containing protein n=1 Tax=Pinctada imbricata TaxID=66713 RepID=A0AA88YKI2_PINIB|nr:hypothetical protein FSP39_016292 [Pinctada imbricata]
MSKDYCHISHGISFFFFRRGLFSSNGNRPKVTSVQDVANFIKEDIFKNIVVVAGAGISTPSGIPDFRTPGTGLYDNLQQYKIPYPEAIFDIDYFHHNPNHSSYLPRNFIPRANTDLITYIIFAVTYKREGCCSALAGIPPEKLVEAHGTFSTATCVICRQKHDGSDLKEPIFSDRLPKCKKRGCPGIVKPDITFFGEDLPQRFYFYLKDMLQTDLVIVMGTSLEVQPFAGIVDTVKWDVPRILFNMHPVGPFRYHRRAQDFVSPGDLISSVQKFAASAGWKADLTELITKEEGSYVVHEGKNSNRDSGVIVNDIKRTDAPSEEKSAQISSFLNGSKQNNSIPPPSEENIESEDKSTQVTFLRKTKPPLPKPQNTVTVKQPLNTLNTRPYGYSQKRLPNRPSVPANLVEKGRLRYVNRELNPRPNSAELPKIAYRHRLQPSYDARIFAIRVPESSSESSLTLESSSESDCG